MKKDLDAATIIQFHDEKLRDEQWPGGVFLESSSDVWHWIETNHRYNTMLWNEEDKARRTDVGDDQIATSKRRIDQYNQKRNDATETIDEAILSELVTQAPNARLNSETAGAMIDRLSILSLKIHHMGIQTRRTDASEEHIRTCSRKLERLIEQREDLGSCLDALLADAREGRARFKIYRQFKMYNDPTLNPYLYGGAGKGRAVP